MSKIAYIEKRFADSSIQIINQANEIIEEYQAQGFDLTLRQLYYVFVTRNLLENTIKSYKRLGTIINDGRLAGYIDWSAMVDRTRNLMGIEHWDSPKQIVSHNTYRFKMDMWENQKYRPEVWIEKDALSGVISSVCNTNDVPFFACKGYTSQSEMWRASQRMEGYANDGQIPLIIHLGDHDPSGVDMSRDIFERIQKTFGVEIEFKRIALNMQQVEQYNPPPNPAKITDTRAAGYIEEFGNESWELDALEPRVMQDLIQEIINEHKDEHKWSEREEETAQGKQQLDQLIDCWDDVQSYLNDLEG